MYTKALRYHAELENENLVLKIQIPGKSKEEVRLSMENDSLKVSISEKENYFIDVSRYYYLGGYDYDLESIKASMKHGLLTVTVPKIKTKDKLIQIE